MTKSALQNKLCKELNQHVELVVNENRSTMLNILKHKRRHLIRLSVHKIFLNAPDHVVRAIAAFIKGTKVANPILKGYIQSHRDHFREVIDSSNLVEKGEVYHLGVLYKALNAQYFNQELALHVTWYGRKGKKNKSRVTFGQYHEAGRLIKIHRFLDDPFFPEYFVSFVLYHEMLHAVIPGHMDERGRYCTHGSNFKKHERLFKAYKQAITWEKTHKHHFFRE